MRNHFMGLMLLTAVLINSWNVSGNGWFVKEYDRYTMMYTNADQPNVDDYNKLFAEGVSSTEAFFKASFSKKFTIIIHPGRYSLDSTWQKDWNMPEFKSECWMV